MKTSAKFLVVLLVLTLGSFVLAETLTGTVKNGTTGQPAAGDDVVLIKLGQGMDEAGRTKTDAQGKFSFKVDDHGPHLIRVIHQGATYHTMAPPGTTSVSPEVYDVAKKLDGISVTADVMRFQAQGSQLQGVRLFAVDNNSSPPRTQLNDQNFEFYLPDGAEVDQGMAQTAGGEPLDTAPVPQKKKNLYAFMFPLRPGQTQFQVTFHLPYSGQANIDPKALYGTQHFVVMLPKTMQFTAGPGTNFQSMKDPRDPNAVVQVASNTTVGQPMAFSIAGTGVMTNGSGGGGQGGEAQAGGAMAQDGDSRPGGGLGPPIEAPDPLEKYRWPLLGGFALILVAGAIYMAKRPQAAAVPDFVPTDLEAPATPPASKTAASSRPGLLLEALKEELFELEMEHKQGKITQQDYDKAKAALDQTLERALKRGSK